MLNIIPPTPAPMSYLPWLIPTHTPAPTFSSQHSLVYPLNTSTYNIDLPSVTFPHAYCSLPYVPTICAVHITPSLLHLLNLSPPLPLPLLWNTRRSTPHTNNMITNHIRIRPPHQPRPRFTPRILIPFASTPAARPFTA